MEWAEQFEDRVRQLLVSGQDEKLVDYEGMGESARLAAPTPDHYLPLLYVLAQRTEADSVSFPIDGIEGGSTSMLSVQIG